MEATDVLSKWLGNLGFPEYLSAFELAEVDCALLPYLTESDLLEIGVQNAHHQTAILEACRKCHPLLGNPSNPEPPVEAGTSSIRSDGDLEIDFYGAMESWDEGAENREHDFEHEEQNEREVVDLTESPIKPAVGCAAEENQGDSTKRKFQATLSELYGVAPSKQRSTNTGAGLNSKPGHVHRQNKRQNTKGKWVPEWQRVPGTSFVVDRFKYIWGVHCDTWFLTHFHADHYGGLGKSFDQGVIYCSPPTAKLVNLRLKVPWNRLVELDINKPKMIRGVRVTFLDANHCPGAVMILFEPPDSLPVLHTGDCRLVKSMQSNPLLEKLRGKRAILVLDTTYCDPKHTFPCQADVISFVVDAVKAESFSDKVLFLFGTYTIGKECVFMEAAKAVGKKVYISAAKREVMGCLDLTAKEKAMMTTNHEETNIHAVPLNQVRTDVMGNIMKRYRGKYTTVVGFQPTGWTFTKGMGKKTFGKRRKHGNMILYQVPYSEHSSFNELVEFVRWFDPKRIIPSVGNDRGPKTQKMLGLLRQENIQTAMAKSQPK
ncbi:hypothetical protein BSKO_03626 [Bryopsis sp. KO-2023]|nr:hypothetical protein BSKO_03626 [Bryopsis sp. KO-2023]